MNNDIYNEKAGLRRLCREKRNSIDKTDKENYDSLICEYIRALPEFCKSSILLAYFPVGSEINVTSLVDTAYKMGKRVAFPVCIDGSKMIFRYCRSLDDLTDGTYSIPAPKEECDVCIPTEEAFCIVPALAVDKFGYRMGYGRGYYDRFLSSYTGACAVVIYEELIFDRIPHNENDIKIAKVITQKGERQLEDEIR